MDKKEKNVYNCRRVMKMTDISVIGKNLKDIRDERNETQEEFAEHCELSVETVSNIERGMVVPRLETLNKIASYIGRPVESLYTK